MSTGKEEAEDSAERDILLEGLQSSPGTKTPQEILDEYKGKDNPIAGTNRLSVESINEARRLWGIEGFDKGMISKQVGLGMNLVEVIIKGIPKGKAPGDRVNIPQMLSQAGITQATGPRVESPSGSGTRVERGTLRRDASTAAPLVLPVLPVCPGRAARIPQP